MSSMKAKRKHRNRAQRYTSNVFAMFSQEQIQEFKEAFNVIDQNRDGFVDKDDLLEMLTSLGKNPTDEFLDVMISEAPGPLNFTMFLTLFGEKLNGTDPEDVIRNAFACFDPEQDGVLPEDYLKELMTTMGDRWTEEQVEELFLGAPIHNGLFDYRQFTRTLKHGSERDEDHKDCPDLPPIPPQPLNKPPASTERERKTSESDKPMVESPRSRRKSLTKPPPERSLEEEFLMRKHSLAASCTAYTKPEHAPARKLSAPAMPKTGPTPAPRKFSQTTTPSHGDLDNPLAAKSGLAALQKDLKPAKVVKDSKPGQKEIKPALKETAKPAQKDLKSALKPTQKSALKKS